MPYTPAGRTAPEGKEQALYFDINCKAAVAFGHSVIEDYVVIRTQKIVDFNHHSQSLFPEGDVATKRNIARVAGLGIVVGNVLLLVAADAHIYKNIVEIPAYP